jgi:hypothetical protein
VRLPCGLERNRSTELQERLAAAAEQPLIGLVLEEDEQQVVRYFADEAAADAAMEEHGLVRASAAIGSWSDLDWDETAKALDRIRHEGTPPPIEP